MLVRRTLAALFVVGIGAGLSACGADDVADQVAEKAAESLAAEDGRDVDVEIDSDSGEVIIDSEEGTIQAGKDELPDGFPIERDDLVEGEIKGTAAVGGGFSVNIQSTQSVADAAALLEGAGFTATESGMEGTALLEGNGLQVIIQQVGPTISYTMAAD